MELIEGIKINNLKELDKAGYDRKKIAENGAKAFIKQILIDGFFHADPHPGNMLVMKDEIIGFMDFGMMGRLDEEMREKGIDLFVAVLERNPNKIINEMLNLGITSPEEIDTRSLKIDIKEMLDQYYDKPLKEIIQGDTLQIIGNVREWNGELYVIPEIVKKVETQWLLVRKLEIQKARKNLPVVENEDSNLRNKIINKWSEVLLQIYSPNWLTNLSFHHIHPYG